MFKAQRLLYHSTSGLRVIKKNKKCGREHRTTPPFQGSLHTAAERGGNDLNYFKDFRTENGSNQWHNMAGLTTRWSTRVLLTPDYGELHDQICTTQDPKVNCVRQVDFSRKGRTPPCGVLQVGYFARL